MIIAVRLVSCLLAKDSPFQNIDWYNLAVIQCKQILETNSHNTWWLLWVHRQDRKRHSQGIGTKLAMINQQIFGLSLKQLYMTITTSIQKKRRRNLFLRQSRNKLASDKLKSWAYTLKRLHLTLCKGTTCSTQRSAAIIINLSTIFNTYSTINQSVLTINESISHYQWTNQSHPETRGGHLSNEGHSHHQAGEGRLVVSILRPVTWPAVNHQRFSYRFLL